MTDLIDIERDPPSGYTALVRFEYFSLLTDDLIGKILFSGYLPRVWHESVGLLMVCKHFMELGKRFISYVDFKSRQWHEIKGGCLADNLTNIGRIADNLVYLDLSYTIVGLNVPEVRSVFTHWRHSLKGLNLRGTEVNDAFCETISQLEQLQYLDISKTVPTSAASITDTGGALIAQLKHLKWLCAASTRITDQTLLLLHRNCRELKHLVLQLCTQITDVGLVLLRDFPLVSLDISGCSLVTAEGMARLCSVPSVMSGALKNVSCSFMMTVPRTPVLNALCRFAFLQRVEIRRRVPEDLDDELVSRVRNRFEIAILNHEDQLRMPNELSIIPFSPPLIRICTVYSWPYSNSGL